MDAPNVSLKNVSSRETNETAGGKGDGDDDSAGDDQEDESESSSLSLPPMGAACRFQGGDEQPSSLLASRQRYSVEKELNELENFRRQWKLELQQTKSSLTNSRGSSAERSQRSTPDIERRARDLFEHGVNEEANGNMMEAIRFYRQAVHLVPDIEFRVGRALPGTFSKNSSAANLRLTGGGGGGQTVPTVNDVGSEDDSEDDNVDEEVVWMKQFATTLSFPVTSTSDSDQGQVDDEKQPATNRFEGYFCRPEDEESSRGRRHICELPLEVMVRILRWVVGCDLDVRQLDQLGLVSRGFYSLSRDNGLWRAICQNSFSVGYNVNYLAGSVDNDKADSIPWRDVFLSTPQVLYNGIYISRTSYMRKGEVNMESNRTFHMVRYYRYFRLFPRTGRCVMLNSPDEPLQVLQSKALNYFYASGPALQEMKTDELSAILSILRQRSGLMSGVFQVTGDALKCILKKPSIELISALLRQRRRLGIKTGSTMPLPAVDEGSSSQTFHAEFCIKRHRSRLFAQLQWLHYSVHTQDLPSGATSVGTFELTSSNFPPLIFSRVRSYTAGVSERPLWRPGYDDEDL